VDLTVAPLFLDMALQVLQAEIISRQQSGKALQASLQASQVQVQATVASLQTQLEEVGGFLAGVGPCHCWSNRRVDARV
jgi:hypothetical protein